MPARLKTKALNEQPIRPPMTARGRRLSRLFKDREVQWHSDDDHVRLIAKASPRTRSELFFRTCDQRPGTWRTNKVRMDRTTPVLEAPVADDTKQEYHCNFFELGFDLKDSREPKVEAAIDTLRKAVLHRPDDLTRSFSSYELSLRRDCFSKIRACRVWIKAECRPPKFWPWASRCRLCLRKRNGGRVSRPKTRPGPVGSRGPI